MDRIGHHGTFTYGRLQYELENSIKRYERLSQDDDYGAIRDGERTRPRTKGTDEEVSSSMYNEKPRKVRSFYTSTLTRNLGSLIMYQNG